MKANIIFIASLLYCFTATAGLSLGSHEAMPEGYAVDATTGTLSGESSSHWDYDPYYEDEFYYSRRLRRFHSGYSSWNYYDPYFANDVYYVAGTPYWDTWAPYYTFHRPRVAVRTSFFWGMFSLDVTGPTWYYETFYPSYSWGWTGYDPFFCGGYYGVGNNWGWSYNRGWNRGYRNGYGNGYYNGYNRGYRHGYANGYNNGSFAAGSGRYTQNRWYDRQVRSSANGYVSGRSTSGRSARGSVRTPSRRSANSGISTQPIGSTVATAR